MTSPDDGRRPAAERLGPGGRRPVVGAVCRIPVPASLGRCGVTGGASSPTSGSTAGNPDTAAGASPATARNGTGTARPIMRDHARNGRPFHDNATAVTGS